MKLFQFLLFSLLWITVFSKVIVKKKIIKFDRKHHSSSSSWSSEEKGIRRHHPRLHRGKPSKPRFDIDNDDDWNNGRPPRPPARPTRICPSDWMTFDRPQGRWCIKVFYGVNTQIGAENLCKAQGATLTGLQDNTERIQVANVARALNNQYGGDLSEVYLGGRRRSQCPSKDSCAPNDTIEWTDGHTTGKNGFYWAPGEPNALFIPGYGIQTCLEMFISVSDSQPARWGSRSGDLDDVQCNVQLKMYACGKVANL